MKRILVTGGAGFIGANFIRFLLDEIDFDGEIISLDALIYPGSRRNQADLESYVDERYHFVQVDICDQEGVRGVLERHQIDTICHFAAETHVDRSIDTPGSFVSSNVLGTFHLLERCRELAPQIRRFHHVSTDEVFGSCDAGERFSESSPYRPNNPYSASKAAGDHFVRAYAQTYRLPVSLSRCSNNFGPYQFAEKLIPKAILALSKGEPVPLYGDGQQVREWLYVDDHCRAIWEILNRAESGADYNIGTGQELTNLQMIEQLAALIRGREGQGEWVTFVADRPGHDRRYAIDATKIRRDFGWKPVETLDTALRKTIDWYLSQVERGVKIEDGYSPAWTGTGNSAGTISTRAAI